MNTPMTNLLRFADLKQAKIVTNWPRLRRLIDGYDFPPGFLLSPGVRVWDAADVEAWVQTRRDACANGRRAPEARP